jgi:photosystem II stability/assembly factor-like uncharacterized protein
MRPTRLAALSFVAAFAATGLTGCGSSSAPQASRSTPPVPESRSLPSSVAFWDGERGLLGAGRCWDCPGGTISTTDDGGRTWTVRKTTVGPLTWVTTLGERNAWALAGRALLHSADGGRSWQAVSKAPLLSVVFTSESEGWGVIESWESAFESRLVRTRDGGRDWQKETSPCPRVVGGVRGVSFPTRARGWLLCVGEPGAGQQQKAVFATRDGGETWAALSGAIWGNESLAGGLGGYGYPEGISFVADGTGILWESRGLLFLTRNGARSWSSAEAVQPEIDFGRSASVADDRVAYVLLERGSFRLLRSEDGGRTWSVVHRWQRPQS